MNSQRVIIIQRLNREFKEWVVYEDGTYVRGERREMPMKHLNDVIGEEQDNGNIVWLETEIYYREREKYLNRIIRHLEMKQFIEGGQTAICPTAEDYVEYVDLRLEKLQQEGLHNEL
ncbi:MAG: hypothetical protein CMJ20_06880 [Phycisphaeraceae bacterium]|nr:hypothetical protein [Phycisphaeraceae bacterium]|tara:strand:+ start:304 stop:654 length:351 start_codon:yes stop_codon:yes gene_type:complete